MGFGLTDGEQLERFWSYLRLFAKITKEMTQSHRLDMLAMAAANFTRKKNLAIGMKEIFCSVMKYLQTVLCLSLILTIFQVFVSHCVSLF